MLAWLGDMIAQTDHGGSVVSGTGVLGVLVRELDTLATASLEGLRQGQGLTCSEAILVACCPLTELKSTEHLLIDTPSRILS